MLELRIDYASLLVIDNAFSRFKDDYVQPPPITSLLTLKALLIGVFMVAEAVSL